MGAELKFIAGELALPDFRVPAPKNSAQHAAATACLQQPPAGPPSRHPTRQFTPDLGHSPGCASHADPELDAPEFAAPEQPPNYPEPPRQFAGIDIDEFVYARQRARRMTAFWVLTVMVLTGLVAAGAWTVGTNLDALSGG